MYALNLCNAQLQEHKNLNKGKCSKFQTVVAGYKSLETNRADPDPAASEEAI